MKIGPTGTFPQGRLNRHDEGALNIALYVEHGKLVMDFAKKTKWIAIDKIGAALLIKRLGQYVDTGT